MDSIKQIELQRAIQENSTDMANAVRDLYNWEKDIKKSETKRNLESEQILTEVRSLRYEQPVNEEKKVLSPTDIVKPKEMSNQTALVKANIEKEKGNKFVKAKDYKEAIECYTNAIAIYKLDPTFYANRSLCYLQLERYNKCITDCSMAINYDSSYVKAYYRRMQAYERLGDDVNALKNCKIVLKLTPQNGEVKRTFQEISGRLGKTDKVKVIEKNAMNNKTKHPWSQLGTRGRDIDFIDKPPHLRSDKTYKKVTISAANTKETLQTTPSFEKNTKEQDNKSWHDENIPDHIIDKLFDNPTHESIPNIIRSYSRPLSSTIVLPSTSAIVEKKNVELNILEETIPPAPSSTANFNRTWNELSTSYQKYLYLKKIDVFMINKLLGASFHGQILADMLHILSEYYIRDNYSVVEILKEIGKNKEMNILKCMMTVDDKIAVEKLVKYMKIRGNDEEDIQLVSEAFPFIN